MCTSFRNRGVLLWFCLDPGSVLHKHGVPSIWRFTHCLYVSFSVLNSSFIKLFVVRPLLFSSRKLCHSLCWQHSVGQEDKSPQAQPCLDPQSQLWPITVAWTVLLFNLLVVVGFFWLFCFVFPLPGLLQNCMSLQDEDFGLRFSFYEVSKENCWALSLLRDKCFQCLPSRKELHPLALDVIWRRLSKKAKDDGGYSGAGNVLWPF